MRFRIQGDRPGWLTVTGRDIEEAVLRCGWTILNPDNVADMTDADRSEVARIEKAGAAGGWLQGQDAARRWWDARFTPDSATVPA